MGWNISIDVILRCYFWFDQPRGTIPGISCDTILDEGTQHLLCEHFSVSDDMIAICQSFFVWVVGQADEVSAEACSSEGAIGVVVGSELCFVSNASVEPLSIIENDSNEFAWIVFRLEVIKDLINKVVDTRSGGELNSAEDGIFQGIGESLVDFAGAGQLASKGIEERKSTPTGHLARESLLLVPVHALQVRLVRCEDLARLRDDPNLFCFIFDGRAWQVGDPLALE